MKNITIFNKNICKWLLVSQICFVLFALANCEADAAKFKNGPTTNLNSKPSDSLGDKFADIGPSIDSIQSLDLKSILFTPSSQPLSFPSIAVGDLIANGTSRNTISLTNSGWTHPSVLYFEKPWNGFHYWCAITPYPNSDSQYENPHIFCSNDGVLWKEPNGIVNPIENSPLGTVYSSDVNLMFKDDALYCYWRDNWFFLSGFPKRGLFVKKSLDGVNWSPKELVASWPASGIDVIAPSILKHDDNYYCYGVCTGEATPGSYYTQYCIRRAVSASELNFTIDRNMGYELINIEGRPWGNKQEPWHTDVQKIGNLWLMLVTTTDNGQYGSSGRLFLGYSLDGVNFSFNDKPISNSIGTYKSGFVPTYDRKNKRIRIQMWRAQVSNNWQIFNDEFFINIS